MCIYIFICVNIYVQLNTVTQLVKCTHVHAMSALSALSSSTKSPICVPGYADQLCLQTSSRCSTITCD